MAGAPVKVTVGMPSVASVVWVSGPPTVKKASAAQFAVSVHVPVPLVMVTVAVALAAEPPTAPTVQTPAVPPMVGMLLEFVVAVTTNVVLYGALAGAPVKVTVGTSGIALRLAMFDHAEERAGATKFAGFGFAGRKLSFA